MPVRVAARSLPEAHSALLPLAAASAPKIAVTNRITAGWEAARGSSVVAFGAGAARGTPRVAISGTYGRVGNCKAVVLAVRVAVRLEEPSLLFVRAIPKSKFGLG